MIRLDNTRQAVRVQESFNVTGTISLPGKDQKFRALVMDISYTGSKMILLDSAPIVLGSLVQLEIDRAYDTDILLPAGRVVRINEVLLDEENHGYIECGVEFLSNEPFDIVELMKTLQKREHQKPNEAASTQQGRG